MTDVGDSRNKSACQRQEESEGNAVKNEQHRNQGRSAEEEHKELICQQAKGDRRKGDSEGTHKHGTASPQSVKCESLEVRV